MERLESDDRETTVTSWHSASLDGVFDRLETDEDGLTTDEAERRRDEYGRNVIRRGESVSPLSLFVAQFQDFLVYLLVLAALLSLGVGLLPGEEPNYVDATLITLILIANGVFGFVQDYRAEQSMAALRELSSPDATVLRDGEKVTVDASAVVPGDVVFLEQGDAVPADARLLSATNLETDEAALTGESTSVSKEPGTTDPDAPLAERTNMVYMNTNSVKGRGTGVVVETGMDTEVGAIATQLREAEDTETPFQREVDRLGRRIGYGVVALVLLLTLIQLSFTSAGPITILLTGITLAVAAVPEGLPAVVTLTLALGSRKLLDRNALVRRLPVVESLGSVDTIVTDKTGTLTESRMTVRRLSFGGAAYEVTGTGLEPDGEFRRDGEAVAPDRLAPLLRCGAVCNDAERAPDSEDEEYYGDPTEVAVLVAAAKAGLDGDHERLREIPFSSERKRMTVVADEGCGLPGAADAPTAYVKGAPETVLERCDRIVADGEVRELTDERRQAVLDENREFAGDALRVLGFACRTVEDADADADAIENDLVFLGLQGMLDPPRSEVREAVADCRQAGIRVVMVTGDNLATATAIGEEIGFDPEGAMTGAEVAELSDPELAEAVRSVEVFARVEPEHKVTILRAIQENGHRVAMTGDGVNDAPALRNADVGVAMGVRGTDVAKQASDMVLQDDNFVTIRDAIAEGRGIFDNVRKFVNYLLSANAGEVLVVFVGVLVGTVLFPRAFASRSEALVLTPVMLLWINLVTDGLPALALGADPKPDDVLDRSPRGDDEPVIDTRMMVSILTIGALMTATGLALFFFGLSRTRDLVVAQSLLFTFLVTIEMVRIQSIRSRYDQEFFSNRWLVGAILVTLALQLLVLYTPLHVFFDVVPLSRRGWTWIGVAFLAFLVADALVSRLYDRTVADDRWPGPPRHED
ncbi:cation-translocating P-type ATPase [Halomicrococcus sp. NG-SE-24]|uniref:cation-translocating P-type ATPase n=1 Tax=Halomicrococcus sp. NG-SE-24 TaxID=3436928 RepID=UPI003D991842